MNEPERISTFTAAQRPMRFKTLAALLVGGLLSAGTAHAQQAPQTIERGTIRQPAAQADMGFRWASRNMGRPVVASGDENSPAARAGLAAGDSIMVVDGRSTLPLRRLFPDAVPGRKYTVQVKRGPETHELVIEAVAPKPAAATAIPLATGAKP